jgi:type III restriction enzyme
MMSFRRAEDHTYIAQLLGRMVRTPLARRIERDAALNDVHLFLPHFDTTAVGTVIADLQNVEDVPPSEIGSSLELVVLRRSNGTEEVFKALDSLITYRVNATRIQSPLRRYMGIARGLTLDEVDLDVWEAAKDKITMWMEEQLVLLKTKGIFEEAANSIAEIGLTTTAVTQGSGESETVHSYHIHASDADIDRLFEESGRILSHGLHMSYWQKHGGRDALDVKIEVIVLAKNHEAMVALEAHGESEFDSLYDVHKKAIGKLREQRRAYYEKLRLATAKPSEVPLHLPEAIDFRRKTTDPTWSKHLYVEESGVFRADLGSWEDGVLNLELANPKVVGWLRNLDRKPWSLEIPYSTGGEIRPMFPDFLLVRESKGDFICDILEPHDASLADNYEKAVGLAQFAEKHGHLFGRIQLIRKGKSPSGQDHYFRLDLNKSAVRKKAAMILSNPQLDALFGTDAT